MSGNSGTAPTRAERDGLAGIRRRRTLLLAALAALPLALIGFYWAPFSRGARELLLLAWVALYAIATLSVVLTRCPRCGHLFHDVRGFRNPLARRCRGCGLGLREGAR